MPVTGITDATTITAHIFHSCAALVGGAVQCWGDNSGGQLGNGTNADSSISVTVSGL